MRLPQAFVAVAAMLLAASLSFAQRGAPLPAIVTLPAEAIVPPAPGTRIAREAYGEAEFPKEAGGLLRGEHWSFALRYPPEATGVPKPTGKDVFAKLAPALEKGGWSVVKSWETHPFAAVLQRPVDGRQAWLSLGIFGPDDIRGDVIVAGPQPMAFSLSPPQSPPPRFEIASGDFPDLPPLPGSQLRGGKRFEQPMRLELVTAEGKRQETMVAAGSTTKTYSSPELSNLQFADAYQSALEAAGWNVITRRQSVRQGDAVLVAHFGKNGRNLWAYMHSTPGEYALTLGEDDADALAREFAKTCRLALYGVVFDFDKATLRPESDATLTRALGLVKASGGARLEVQGHTDNVGGDEYNQKLSEARAAAVETWFTAHGVPAAQLSSHGYGKIRPVADNATPEGRAKNRRVEISRVQCAG